MPNIFISYRRNDAPGYAGRLHDVLKSTFITDTVFLDVDSLRAGVEFRATILQHLVPPAVAIAVIGRGWLGRDAEGTRSRLFDVDDFVRLELLSARENGTPVVPVLVNGAGMPQEQELPETLRWLTTLQAFELSDSKWTVDVKALADELDRVLAAQRTSCKVLICMAQRHRDHKESWDSLYRLTDQLHDRGIHVDLLRMAGKRDEQTVRERILGKDMVMVCLWPRDSLPLVYDPAPPSAFSNLLATLGLWPALAYEDGMHVVYRVAIEERSPEIPVVFLRLVPFHEPLWRRRYFEKIPVVDISLGQLPKLMALIDAQLAFLRTQPHRLDVFHGPGTGAGRSGVL